MGNSSDYGSFIKDNLGAIGAGVGGVALGGALGYIAGSSVNKAKSSKKRKTSKKKTGNYRRTRRSRYTPRTAGKAKDTSRKRIRYTSNGQPYVIMASGKARFIKKTGARRAHKTKGGRY